MYVLYARKFVFDNVGALPYQGCFQKNKNPDFLRAHSITLDNKWGPGYFENTTRIEVRGVSTLCTSPGVIHCRMSNRIELTINIMSFCLHGRDEIDCGEDSGVNAPSVK